MSRIAAHINNSWGNHQVILRTNDNEHSVTIAPKPDGMGSSANGGELLFLALATCYCNDIYREAAQRNITVRSVQVEVSGDFNGPGALAENVTYTARVEAEASEEAIRDLVEHTDRIAEIHESLRRGTAVKLTSVEVVPVAD